MRLFWCMKQPLPLKELLLYKLLNKDLLQPPLSQRSYQQLLEIIAHHQSWRSEVVEAARQELLLRGLTSEDILSHSDYIREQAQYLKEKQDRINAIAPLNVGDWIAYTVFFPLHLLDDWSYYSQGYHRKSRQRTKAFVTGLIIWITCFYVSAILFSDSSEASASQSLQIVNQYKYHGYLIVEFENQKKEQLNIEDFIQTSNSHYEDWPKPVDAFFVDVHYLEITGDMHQPPDPEKQKRFIQIWPPRTTLYDTISCAEGKLLFNSKVDSITSELNRLIQSRNVIP